MIPCLLPASGAPEFELVSFVSPGEMVYYIFLVIRIWIFEKFNDPYFLCCLIH